MMNAMPLSGGNARSNSTIASNPPAEAPMPTTHAGEFCALSGRLSRGAVARRGIFFNAVARFAGIFFDKQPVLARRELILNL
jgi:hypothetical protein